MMNRVTRSAALLLVLSIVLSLTALGASAAGPDYVTAPDGMVCEIRLDGDGRKTAYPTEAWSSDGAYHPAGTYSSYYTELLFGNESARLPHASTDQFNTWTGRQYFLDVPSSHRYAYAINTLYELGAFLDIMPKNGRLDPDGPIEYGEFLYILSRLVGLNKDTVQYTNALGQVNTDVDPYDAIAAILRQYGGISSFDGGIRNDKYNTSSPSVARDQYTASLMAYEAVDLVDDVTANAVTARGSKLSAGRITDDTWTIANRIFWDDPFYEYRTVLNSDISARLSRGGYANFLADESGSFHPQRVLTFGEACHLLENANLLQYVSVSAASVIPNQSPVVIPPETAPEEETAPSAPSSRFTDISGDEWYAAAVDAMDRGGLLTGYDDGSFRPDDPVTAGQLAAVLCGAYNIRAEKNIGHWAAPYIDALQRHGLTVNFPSCNIRQANEPVNRGEALSALSLLPFRLGMELDDTYHWRDIPDSYTVRQAGPEGHRWNSEAILNAYNYGLTSGVDEAHTCDPAAPLTRAALCRMLCSIGVTRANMVPAP